jgi:hypothetical protein
MAESRLPVSVLKRFRFQPTVPELEIVKHILSIEFCALLNKLLK